MDAPSTAEQDLALTSIPRAPGTWLGGNLTEYQKDMLGTMMRHAQTYGDIVRIRLGPRKLYFLNHPDYARHILQDNHRNYDKGTRGWRKLKILLRNGVFVSDGPTWLRQRRTMQPAFHHKKIASFLQIMVEEAHAMNERWQLSSQSGNAINIASEMMAITFLIIAKTMFHTDVAADIERVRTSLPVILKYVSDSYRTLLDLPLFIPTRQHLQVNRALKTLDAVVFKLIDERRTQGVEQYDDLLAMLMSARDPVSGQGMNDEELRDQVMTILMAGHETTANALSFTWYLLSKHPDVRERLEKEADQVLGDGEFNIFKASRLSYTRQVFLEALRLYPPAWVFARRSISDDQIAGYSIPAHSTLFICTYTLHRHPAFWTKPESFDPERFTTDRIKNRPRFVYLPFSAGPRQCMGEDFAMLEAVVILATLARRFRLETAPQFHLELDPAVALRPKKGLMMTIKERN